MLQGYENGNKIFESLMEGHQTLSLLIFSYYFVD